MQVGPNKCGKVNHQSSINREDPFLILTPSNLLKSAPQVCRGETDRLGEDYYAGFAIFGLFLYLMHMYLELYL